MIKTEVFIPNLKWFLGKNKRNKVRYIHILIPDPDVQTKTRPGSDLAEKTNC